MADEIDFESFPVVGKGNRFQDFTEGQQLAHHWGRTLTDGDNAIFSTATCNWNPMHLNAEYARAHDHPDVVVNPMLVLCTVVGLSVEDLSETGGPFLGMEDVIVPPPRLPGRHHHRFVGRGRDPGIGQPARRSGSSRGRPRPATNEATSSSTTAERTSWPNAATRTTRRS